MDAVVRDAVVADADEMGRIHVAAWRSAYEGLMPADYLSSITAEDRTEMWERTISLELADSYRLLVAELRSRGVVGFAMVGPEDRDQPSAGGQLIVINVHPDAWGSGAAQVLHDTAVDSLGDWFDRAILWVHPDNPRARRFYERNGWVNDAVTKEEDVLGVVVPEVRYSRTLKAVN